jgi:hypothetical protein
MSLFPDTIKEALAGRKPKSANLVLFDFLGEPVRLWTGNGRLNAGGQSWDGIGRLGAISGLEQAINGEAPEASFVLSAIDAQIMRLAREEFEEKAKNRMAKVFVQFFRADDDVPLDQPFPIWAGRMHAPLFNISADGAREVTVTAESLFTLRSRPNFAMYTDSDQQKRFADDKGFGFIGTLRNKVVTWPDW